MIIRDPSIALWIDILTALRKAERTNDAASGRVAGIISDALKKKPDEVALNAQLALGQIEEALEKGVKDERKLAPYRKLVGRMRKVFSPQSLANNWATFSADIISEDMIDTLSLLDAELARSVPDEATLVEIRGRVTKLRGELPIEKLSPSVAALIVGHLDLMDRALAKLDVVGVTNFSEKVNCAVGELELRLRLSDELSDLDTEVLRGVADDLLRISGVVALGSEAAKRLPFLSEVVALLTHNPG